MQKTIVVEIEMRKAPSKYKRVMKSNKKFITPTNEQNSASRSGDVVRIREARPLSKLQALVARGRIVRRLPLSRSPMIRKPAAAVEANNFQAWGMSPRAVSPS